MARTGPINSPIILKVKFYNNGTLFTPFDVDSVKIYDVATGTPTPLATLVPTSPSTGNYEVSWDALDSSPSLLPGTYYDEWTWTAQSGMVTNTQRFSFTLTTAEVTPPAPETPNYTITDAVEIYASCNTPPTWLRRVGLTRVEDIGNGMGIELGWEEAIPVDYNRTIHYNIYYETTRFDLLNSSPKAITKETNVIVNIPPGNTYYFAVRAAEFDTDIAIEEMGLLAEDVYEYPAGVVLLNYLPDTYDGYRIAVTDTTGFPDVGELLIDYEAIRYASVDRVTNEFVVAVNNRAILSTNIAEHDIGAAVGMWHGVEDGNTVILSGVAAWDHENGTPRNVSAVGEVNVDLDGYRAALTDNLTTNLVASDADTIDFPTYDFNSYHRPSMQQTLGGGKCVNSYLGGEFNGRRGFDAQERSLSQLDMMLQVTGEPVILLKRKWTGKRCQCMDLRREHQRTRCSVCLGTGFAGAFDRYRNLRAVSENWKNTQGFIMIRVSPFKDDLKLESNQGLIQPSEISAWTINTPTLKDRDVIVRYTLDFEEEFRYEILDVTRNRLFFAQSGKMEFVMRRLDKTDAIYSFPIEIF